MLLKHVCKPVLITIHALLILAAILLGISCAGSSIQKPEESKTGFALHSYAESDSTVYVIVAWIDLLENMPHVKINNRDPDTARQELYMFQYQNVPAGKKIELFIAHENDTVLDSIFIPPMIDSVWSNGAYIPRGTTVGISNLNDTCILKWKTSAVGNGFIATYQSSSFGDSHYANFVDTDSLLILRRNANEPDHIYFRVSQMATLPNSKETKPAFESDRMYVYYDISGPMYTGYIVRK